VTVTLAPETDPVETVRALRSDLAARAGDGDRLGRLCDDDVEAIRSSGLLGLMVPVDLGGAGADFSTYARVATELGHASGAVALVYNMHASVTGALAAVPESLLVALGATEEARERRDDVLRAAADGAFYAVAMSERGAGARLSRITTSYREEGGALRLTGSKAFVSGAEIADAYLVAARSEVRDLISFFVVPAGEGITIDRTWDSLGMRATGSQDVHFDVVLPPTALIGGIEGLGRVVAESMPQWLVASYAAVYVGVARAALEAATEHIRARELTGLSSVRARIGRADALVAAAEGVVQTAAQWIDSAPGTPEANRWIWRAKLVAGDVAAEVASSVLEAAGTSAMRRGNPLERLYRDARCGALQPATSDVCADWLGMAALGLDPDRAAEIPRW
jgi:alkylation response protein AidB-like acyl-CoA dehydrogenase